MLGVLSPMTTVALCYGAHGNHWHATVSCCSDYFPNHTLNVSIKIKELNQQDGGHWSDCLGFTNTTSRLSPRRHVPTRTSQHAICSLHRQHPSFCFAKWTLYTRQFCINCNFLALRWSWFFCGQKNIVLLLPASSIYLILKIMISNIYCSFLCEIFPSLFIFYI